MRFTSTYSELTTTLFCRFMSSISDIQRVRKKKRVAFDDNVIPKTKKTQIAEMSCERSNTKREKPTQPDAININRNSSINFRQTPATSKFPRWPIFSIPIAAYILRIHCRLMGLWSMCFCSVRTSGASLVVVVLILHRRVSHCFDLFSGAHYDDVEHTNWNVRSINIPLSAPLTLLCVCGSCLRCGLQSLSLIDVRIRSTQVVVVSN